MILQLGVSLEGHTEFKLLLSTLRISLQKKITASAVRSAAGPLAVDLRKQIRAISRASPTGTYTLARNIVIKMVRARQGEPTIKAVIGARRRVRGPALDAIARRRPSKRAEALPSQEDEGSRKTLARIRQRQGKKSIKNKFRVPSRYFHFLERGFTNWQTGRRIAPKAPMRIAMRRAQALSQQRFHEQMVRGIIRETFRNRRAGIATAR